MAKTAIIADRRYTRHFAGRGHPERPERIEAMLAMVESLKYRSANLSFFAPRTATLEEIALCHRPDYIEQVEQTAGMDRFEFDPDTHTSPQSFETALLAAGGMLTAIEAVIDGAADNAFAAVRPPGHHALSSRAMGFCFFNNVAIGAAYLTEVRKLKRVMILDWDLHHGNGTQELFYSSPRVLYVSTHQYPFYPGTGAVREIGAEQGAGFTVNVPMPAGFGDKEYLRAFDDLIVPVARQFKPEFILVSAGFDCHYRDPLGGMSVSEEGFSAMTRRLKHLAAEYCAGRMVAVLEGGYDLQALGTSGEAVIKELGREADEPIAQDGGQSALAVVQAARRILAPFWTFD